MTIRPTAAGISGQSEATRTSQSTARGNTAGRSAERRPIESRADEVRISEQARDLQMQAAPDTIPHDEVAPERLRSIAQRIEQGHYELPQVIDETLRRMARDL